MRAFEKTTCPLSDEEKNPNSRPYGLFQNEKAHTTPVFSTIGFSHMSRNRAGGGLFLELSVHVLECFGGRGSKGQGSSRL